MTGSELASKRRAAGISGDLLCRHLNIARGTLSAIEAGIRPRSVEELLQISATLDQLIRAKRRLSAIASEMGLGFDGTPLALGIKAGRF